MAKTAIVIGSGIAGCITASFLQQHGIDVKILEAGSKTANGGSGNPICIMYPRFDNQDNKYTKFYLAAYRKALKFYQDYPDYFIKSGVMINYHPNKEKKYIALSQNFPREICYLSNSPFGKGLFFPNCGYLHTKELCKRLTNKIPTYYNHHVTNINYLNDKWHITSTNNQPQLADYLIIACSYQSTILLPYLKEFLYPVAGQSSLTSYPLNYQESYVTCLPDISISPSINGYYYFGATYDRINLTTSISLEAHKQNLKNLSNHLKNDIDECKLKGFAGIRCFSKDYLPLIGKLYQHKNLYINLAHGSRGVISAPIAADIITKNLLNYDEESHLIKFISPNRIIK